MVSAYIEIAFACLLNYYKPDTFEGGWGMILSTSFMIFHSLILFGYPVWLFFFLRSGLKPTPEWLKKP